MQLQRTLPALDVPYRYTVVMAYGQFLAIRRKRKAGQGAGMIIEFANNVSRNVE